jgi:hypothetical protein
MAVSGNNPDGMDDSRNIAQDRQQDIEPELTSEANREKYADRRQKDGKDYAQNIAHQLLRFAAQSFLERE